MWNEKAITPIFYVRGMNTPYNEGHIQIVNSISKALMTQNVQSIVFNYKYKLNENTKDEISDLMRYDQSIPVVLREKVFHSGKKPIAIYSSLLETILSPNFFLAERKLKLNDKRYVTNVVNCFRYPRVLAKRLLNNPLVVHFYMRSASNGFFPGVIFEKADKIIVSSKTVAIHIEKTRKIEAEKIQVIYPPIDVDFYRPLDKKKTRKIFGFQEDSKIILYIGNLGKNRFPEDIVLRTLSDLSKQNPLIRLLVFAPMTGENIQRLVEIRTKAKRLNLLDKISVNTKNLSFNEKRMLYGLSDLFLFPSLDSGIATEPPLTALESMASGLPVISNDLLSMKEIINEGTDGAIVSFNKNETEQLTSKISYCLENEDFLKNASHNSRRKIVDEMSLEVSGKKIMAFYRSLF